MSSQSHTSTMNSLSITDLKHKTGGQRIFLEEASSLSMHKPPPVKLLDEVTQRLGNARTSIQRHRVPIALIVIGIFSAFLSCLAVGTSYWAVRIPAPEGSVPLGTPDGTENGTLPLVENYGLWTVCFVARKGEGTRCGTITDTCYAEMCNFTSNVIGNECGKFRLPIPNCALLGGFRGILSVSIFWFFAPPTLTFVATKMNWYPTRVASLSSLLCLMGSMVLTINVGLFYRFELSQDEHVLGEPMIGQGGLSAGWSFYIACVSSVVGFIVGLVLEFCAKFKLLEQKPILDTSQANTDSTVEVVMTGEEHEEGSTEQAERNMLRGFIAENVNPFRIKHSQGAEANGIPRP